jgi:hypothetical protein
MGKKFKKGKGKSKKKNKNKEKDIELNSIEDHFIKINESRKCRNSKEYLDKYQNDKTNWKFNVNKII